MRMAYIVPDEGLFPAYITHFGHVISPFQKQEPDSIYDYNVYVKFFYLIFLIFCQQFFTKPDVLERLLVNTDIRKV